MHGGDVARLLGVLPQRLAQGAQTGPQHPLAHHRLGPDRIEQGRGGHHLPGLRHQLPQHRQRLGRHGHHLRLTPQRAVRPCQPIWPKVPRLLVRHGPSPLGSAPLITETPQKRHHFVKTSRAGRDIVIA
jgi:hypothetical protein